MNFLANENFPIINKFTVIEKDQVRQRILKAKEY